MAGEDATSSWLEEPALAPLQPQDLSREKLIDLGSKIINCTWKSGLPQWSWGEGVYLLNEVRFYEATGIEIPQRVVDWFTHREAITSGHINNVAPGAAAARLHALGKMNSREITDSLEKWVGDTHSATRAKNGAVEHWPGGVWADTCYLMGTFMLNFGVVTNNSKFVEFIGDQLVKHAEILQNPQTNLFAHGSHRGETLWNYWGRGNAWTALSIVEFLDACEVLEISPITTSVLKKSLEGQLKALINLLPEYGVWDVLVDHQIENAGILETSATAGIGSAMIRAARHLPAMKTELIQTGMRASAASLTYIDDAGVLTRTSAGTVLQLIPFGYSVIRNDRLQLWGQGLALAAITALLTPDANELAIIPPNQS